MNATTSRRRRTAVATVLHDRRPDEEHSATAPIVVRDLRFALSAAASACSYSASTAPARRRSCASSPGLEVYDTGDVVLGTGVSVGYYAQEHEGITAGAKVIDHVRHVGRSTTETERRGVLGAFGLTGDVAFQDAGTLSGGEKTKLALAQLVAGRHNLLLLDEPTNNLDPPSRSAIGGALSSWPGSIVLVSHDTEFVDALAPDIALVLPEGTIDYWSNDLLDLVPLA